MGEAEREGRVRLFLITGKGRRLRVGASWSELELSWWRRKEVMLGKMLSYRNREIVVVYKRGFLLYFHFFA